MKRKKHTKFKMASTGVVLSASNGWSLVQIGKMVYQVDPSGKVRKDKVAFLGKVV